MTDPRIAALAEALRTVTRGSWSTPTRKHPDAQKRQDEEWLRKSAAAILAALPPDWCGHDPTLYVQVADLTERLEAAEPYLGEHTATLIREYEAEIARLRDDLAHCERAWEDAGNELDRLRKIEEAAEEASDRLDTLWSNVPSPQNDPEGWAQTVYFVRQTLRAALGEDR